MIDMAHSGDISRHPSHRRQREESMFVCRDGSVFSFLNILSLSDLSFFFPPPSLFSLSLSFACSLCELTALKDECDNKAENHTKRGLWRSRWINRRNECNKSLALLLIFRLFSFQTWFWNKCFQLRFHQTFTEKCVSTNCLIRKIQRDWLYITDDHNKLIIQVIVHF